MTIRFSIGSQASYLTKLSPPTTPNYECSIRNKPDQFQGMSAKMATNGCRTPPAPTWDWLVKSEKLEDNTFCPKLNYTINNLNWPKLAKQSTFVCLLLLKW